MFVQLFVLVAGCLLVTEGLRTGDDCEKWKTHKNFHLLHYEDDCGKVKINRERSSRILNGKDSPRGTVPWIAFIQINSGKGKSRCGGSIINDNYILTAAHCIVQGLGLNITVALGVEKIKNDHDVLVEKYNVTQYHVHPDYDNVSTINDIGLLRLDRRISFKSSFINYVCLPNSCALRDTTNVGDNLNLSGWGLITNSELAPTLQSVTVPLKKCLPYTTGGKTFPPAASQLCAGSGEFMACLGDSGGPLVRETPAGSAVQVGVVSFGPGKCDNSTKDQADYFSRVSSFMGWILDTIKE